jgi:DNA polymerase III subunit delta
MSWLSDYEHEIQNIRNGKLQEVYFLNGGDFYLRDTAIQSIRKTLKSKTDYDYSISNGQELDANDLQNQLFGSSLFQSARCVVIHEVKGLLPSARKILQRYLEQPLSENVLILTAAELEYKNAFYKRIREQALTLMTTTPFENEIPAWIRSYLATFDRSIEAAAISELLRIVGPDLGKLSNELDKIDIYLPEKQEIKEADIRQLSGYSRMYSVEELLRTLGKKDKAAAVTVCQNLIENGINGVYLIIALYQYFWKLLMLKDQRLLQQSKDLGKSLRIYRSRQLDELKAVALHYTMPQLVKIVGLLIDADRRQKTTAIDTVANFMIVIDGIMRA